MRVRTATTPLPTTTAPGRNPTPSARRNIWGRNSVTGLSPSNTWVKPVARRLAQRKETVIRKTGSTTANSPCNLPLQTQQSRPSPHQTCSSGVVIPPFPSQHPIGDDVSVSRQHPHTFSSYVRKCPPAIGPGVEHQPQVLCVCVCIKLHITVQSGPVILVIIRDSH